MNIEHLNALSRSFGFRTKVIRSAAGLDLDDERAGQFSIIVAAPPYDCDSRYRPFNFKSSGEQESIERNQNMLVAAAETLSHDGLMFVYGLPAHLARYRTALSSLLTLRYWISVRTMTAKSLAGSDLSTRVCCCSQSPARQSILFASLTRVAVAAIRVLRTGAENLT